VTFAGRRNTRREFWISNAIEKQLRNPSIKPFTVNNVAIIPIAFDDITAIDDIRRFMIATISNLFEDSVKGNDQVYPNDMKVRILASKKHNNGYYSDYIANKGNFLFNIRY